MSNGFLTVGDYLLTRLEELGVKHIFGVPGDYNLSFLDQVVKNKNLKWIGNCNELNASYCADGYSRVNGLGAVITTFAVGSFSALNGIAGAYAEYVPVISIVGAPSLEVQNSKKSVHHTFADGKYDLFWKAFKDCTVMQVNLTKENAAKLIDEALIAAISERRPVLITLPIGVHLELIKAPKNKLKIEERKSHKIELQKAVKSALAVVKDAKSVVGLVDYLAVKFKMIDLVEKVIDKHHIPFITTCASKACISEKNSNYIGLFAGAVSTEDPKNAAENSEKIILFGHHDLDLTTNGFFKKMNKDRLIEILPNEIRIGRDVYKNVYGIDFLKELLKAKDSFKVKSLKFSKTKPASVTLGKGKITQKKLWPSLVKFLDGKYHIIAETGSSLFGTQGLKLGKDVTYSSQPLWASIGYAFGSSLGAALAFDGKKRVVIITGDGSFQLTAQEISNATRYKTNTIVFLINNDGYLVERAIHGPKAIYNDIPTWDYSGLAKAIAHESLTFQVKTEDDLLKAFKLIDKNKNKVCFIEVFTGKMDMPHELEVIGKLLEAQDSKHK